MEENYEPRNVENPEKLRKWILPYSLQEEMQLCFSPVTSISDVFDL
jgi:hypothetical protein